jgi:hypothetical protein
MAGQLLLLVIFNLLVILIVLIVSVDRAELCDFYEYRYDATRRNRDLRMSYDAEDGVYRSGMCRNGAIYGIRDEKSQGSQDE